MSKTKFEKNYQRATGGKMKFPEGTYTSRFNNNLQWYFLLFANSHVGGCNPCFKGKAWLWIPCILLSERCRLRIAFSVKMRVMKPGNTQRLDSIWVGLGWVLLLWLNAAYLTSSPLSLMSCSRPQLLLASVPPRKVGFSCLAMTGGLWTS